MEDMTLRFNSIYIAIILCSCILNPLNAETNNRLNDATKEKIDKFINTINKCRYGTGLTLAVVSGEESYTQGYGPRNIDTQEKVDADTRFDIGSVTKHFATILLGILLDEHE